MRNIRQKTKNIVFHHKILFLNFTTLYYPHPVPQKKKKKILSIDIIYAFVRYNEIKINYIILLLLLS